MKGPVNQTSLLACLDNIKNPIFANRIFVYFMRQSPESRMTHLHVKYPGACIQTEHSTNRQFCK